MKYFFLLSEKFYRFIAWEWNTLTNLRRTKRKNFFLRGSFALFSLLSILFLIFSPPIAFGLLFGEGLKFSTFFIWIWILNLKFFWRFIIYIQRLFKIKKIKIYLMPKIFKQNKFALLGANILIILLWVTISSFLINLFQSENAPFYIYKISFLIRFLPPVWVTWFLWIKRGGLKR